MNRHFISIVIFLVSSLFASAQTLSQHIHPRLETLFSELKEKGCKVNVEKEGYLGMMHSRLKYNIYLSYDNEKNRDDHQNQVKAIRRALDDLAESSCESYRYEYHKNGLDTMMYSLNLSDTLNTARYHQSDKTYLHSNEMVTFDYYPIQDGLIQSLYGHLHYEVMLMDDVPEAESEKYTPEMLDKDIALVFKNAGLKERKARWEYGVKYTDSMMRTQAFANDISMVSISGNTINGETELSIYTLPIDSKKNAQETERCAMEIFHQIDDLARHFTDCRPKLAYNYVMKEDRRFKENSVWDEFFYVHPTPGKDPYGSDTPRYILAIGLDEYGYHFAVARTKGSLWVPRNWPFLKSFDNGEKKYFRGMKPKKGK